MTKIEASSFKGERSTNEDAVGLPMYWASHVRGERIFHFDAGSRQTRADKGCLCVVSDGVGGNAGGELASRLVVTEIGRRYYADPTLNHELSLRRIIEAVNRHVRKLQAQEDYPLYMQSTVVAAVVQGNQVLVANVGDSRVYHLRGGQADCLTADHSWVQQQIDQGQTSADDHAVASRRSEITRSIGYDDQVGIDLYQEKLEVGDRVLLCTDGLSGFVSLEQLGTVGSQRELKVAVTNLITLAHRQGSYDNVSAILISVTK